MGTEAHPASKLYILEQAKTHAEEAGYIFSPELLTTLEGLSSEYFDCIDDRAMREGRFLGIPGAGLGVLMLTFAGLTRAGIKFDHAEIARAVEGVIGTPSYHTDSGSVNEGNPLCCAGCGHCANALLKDPEGYLITPDTIAYLQDEYLPKLSQKVQGVVYDGEHDASAVFIVHGLDIGFNPYSSVGNAYIYHIDWHKRIARALAEQLAPIVSADVDILEESIWEAAKVRVGSSVKYLAKGYPVFNVRNVEGELVVEQR